MLLTSGIFFVTVALVLLFLIFKNVLWEEIKYTFRFQPKEYVVKFQEPSVKSNFTKAEYIQPIDSEFSIVIPKIGANAKVIPNVDPYDSQEYQQKLTQGVAHAKGTVFPGQVGNTFLFAHSSENFYEASKYNSIFYLLEKLTKGDYFYIAYQNVIYKYEVTEKKIVGADEIKYLQKIENGPTATLMTCWPAGTTFKRLIVVGRISN
jgi:sortase A